MPPWTLVTPASRGIGLELARRLLRTTNLPVVATARGDLDQTREGILRGQGEDEDGSGNAVAEPSGGEGVEGSEIRGVRPLRSMARVATGEEEGRLKVLRVDVCDESTIAAAATDCSNLFPSTPQTPNHLHASFILPGVLYPEKSPSHLSAPALAHTFQLNTIAPLLLLKHFSPHLPRKSTSHPLTSTPALPAGHATWSTLSARIGSISDNNALGGWYSYRASKAAVNQVTRTFDNYLAANAGDKAVALALHPGTVRTGLSRAFWAGVPRGKLFEPGFAAERLLGVVGGVGWEGDTRGDGEVDMQVGAKGMRGRCWDWRGVEVLP